jgi:hypothetical protein
MSKLAQYKVTCERSIGYSEFLTEHIITVHPEPGLIFNCYRATGYGFEYPGRLKRDEFAAILTLCEDNFKTLVSIEAVK